MVRRLLVEARAPCLSSRSGLGHYNTYSLGVAGSGRLRNVLETGDQVQSRWRLRKGIWPASMSGDRVKERRGMGKRYHKEPKSAGTLCCTGN